MNLQEFVNEYSAYIAGYKEYSNGRVRLTIEPKGKAMWLKRMAREKLNMRVFTSSPWSGTYWFEPIDN